MDMKKEVLISEDKPLVKCCECGRPEVYRGGMCRRCWAECHD